MGWTIYGYLIQFLFWIPLTILFFRIALPLVRAPFSDPLVGWVYSVTNPLLRPLERHIPRWRNFSIAAALLFWLVASLEFALLLRFYGHPGTWLVGGLVGAISFATGFLIALIILSALFTLFQPRAGSSFVFLTERLASPLVRRVRRYLPPVGPFDLSPAVAVLLLVILRMLLAWLVFKLSGF
ncbi:MAG: YggT family protein [Rhodanobacteraceae bacterium]|nr:YggT family protein [Rhodanobacteraceae bacterium]